MTTQDQLAALKSLAKKDGVPEKEILEDWEITLREMSRAGFNVASAFYDLQWLKAEHDRDCKQRLHRS